MKAFCQIPDCNQETQGKSCNLCGVHICQNHSHVISLSFDTEDFWTVEASIATCRDYYLNKKRFLVWQAQSVDRTIGTFTANRYKGSLVSYRYFYERVVPHVKLPNWVGAEKVFCIACLEKHMDAFNKELNDNFFPVLRAVKNSGFICRVFETCFLDIVGKGKSHCYEHAP